MPKQEEDDHEKTDSRQYSHSIVSNTTENYIRNLSLGLSEQEALDIVSRAVIQHEDDLNFPEKDFEKLCQLSKGREANHMMSLDQYRQELLFNAAMIHYYSPYPEVRAVTDPYDDQFTPCNTFRAYFLGLTWALIGASVNTFFIPRLPRISLGSQVIQILVYPCGRALEKILPDKGFTWQGQRYSLNPGPWSYKEQMFATIIFSVANGGAYAAIYNIMVQKLDVYYGDPWATIGFQVLLVLSTQFIGFGFAGVLRRIVVYPVRAMWPTLLPTIALNRALTLPESFENVNGWTCSRNKFFAIFFVISFVYFWFPNYLFQALSNFNWICWIAPKNFTVNTITGMNGMGINPISSFDLNIIMYSSPLILPFFTQANIYGGVLLAGIIIIPALYWSNYKWTAYLPINSNKLFTNKGELYQVRNILTGGLIDYQKYQAYSPPFYSAANLLTYGAFFVLYPMAIIEIFYFQGKAIASAIKNLVYGFFKRSQSNFKYNDDPYCRLMSHYPEVPDYWFALVLAVSIILGILCVTLYPTNTPVWGIFFALSINFVFLIPITIIYSTTGFTFGLNVLVELIVGYALPGNGTALMILKAYGYNIDGQAQNYITDQKMGHYCRIPPRALFKAQLAATFIQSFVSIGIVNWQIANIPDLCRPHQVSRFVCPDTNTYYAASIIWGVIGPKILFGSLYPILSWCFLIGALLPFPLLFFKSQFKKKLKYFHPIICLSGLLTYAPYSAAYYTPGFYIGWLFMHFIKKHYNGWWCKYNYILFSAITAGTGLSTVVIFFAVQYHPKDLKWWGNNVFSNTLDGGGMGENSALLPLPEKGYFGPPSGKYPTNL